MKRLIFPLACAALLPLVTGRNAYAETLGFDDLSGIESPLPNGYNGFNFANFFDITSGFAATLGANSGYMNGIVSPSTAIFNGAVGAATISAVSGTFTLDSFDLTGGWNNGLNVAVTGSAAGVVLDTANFTVGVSAPTLETLNWTGVDTLSFVSSGGTSSVPGPSPGQGFVLDNLTVTPAATTVTAVTPEPGSFVLLGTGLMGIAGVVRRRVLAGR